ncbi:MAG: NERD domain-containing protein [Coriobacteriia bacterium]|nr:NERD domain-containing protein [Coriobacteriia bacterium]
MAHTFGRPAYIGARRGAVKIGLLVTGLLAWGVIEVVLTMQGQYLSAFFGFLVGMAILIALAPRVGRLARDAGRHFRELKRADGGMLVDRELSTLPRTYAIFTDMNWNLGGSGAPDSVGHVVVGPTGVFAVRIERRRQSGPAVSSGTSNIDSAEQVARSMREALAHWSGGELSSVPVEAIIVYTAGGAIMEHPRTSDVRTVRSFELSRAIMQDRRRDLLTSKQVYWISRALYGRMESRDQIAYGSELEALGALSKAAWV